MSILSGFARGLLSLLDSQNFGEAPKSLSDTISPIVDTTGLYLLTKQSGVVGLVAVPAGLNRVIQVPLGEVWRVHAGGVFVLNPVAVTNTWTPFIEVSGIVVPIAPSFSVPASATRMQPMTVQPFFLSAGDWLGVYGSELVGVPTAVSCAYVVSRLKA